MNDATIYLREGGQGNIGQWSPSKPSKILLTGPATIKDFGVFGVEVDTKEEIFVPHQNIVKVTGETK